MINIYTFYNLHVLAVISVSRAYIWYCERECPSDLLLEMESYRVTCGEYKLYFIYSFKLPLSTIRVYLSFFSVYVNFANLQHDVTVLTTFDRPHS